MVNIPLTLYKITIMISIDLRRVEFDINYYRYRLYLTRDNTIQTPFLLDMLVTAVLFHLFLLKSIIKEPFFSCLGSYMACNAVNILL